MEIKQAFLFETDFLWTINFLQKIVRYALN